MGKSSKKKGNKKESKEVVACSNDKKRKAVEVVVCPSAFPDFQSIGSSYKRKERRRNDDDGDDPHSKRKKSLLIDINETAQEVHALGSSAFTGKLKRAHKEEEYKQLTGRSMKKQKMPIAMVAGLRKAAKKRADREEQEAREAGIITTTSKKKKRTNQFNDSSVRLKGFNAEGRRQEYKNSRVHGPAPSVGFMKGGVLRVKNYSKK
mmetsp:Transcript_33217/g.49506  ORF Transcript_33217/g.49506 Transcript_33217/m.49506 type:complete len:206 (-) Transcript_33217:48-665(-)